MELIGEFHRDKILNLPETQRKRMDLPPWRNAEVVNEIFGWVIKQGKEVIQCRSEDEALFIWALWSYDWPDFWVPTDDAYLAEITPKVIKLKKGHDEYLEGRFNLYSNRKVREELKRRVYLLATLRSEEIEVEQMVEEDPAHEYTEEKGPKETSED